MNFSVLNFALITFGLETAALMLNFSTAVVAHVGHFKSIVTANQ
jgi:hypothetical protein